MLESKRLILRKLTPSDFEDLCKILQDPEVMYAYEGAFTDAEVHEWLEKQLRRYETDGIGLYAVILKENGDFIGQCGITKQAYNEIFVFEIGYLFQKAYWHKGYATEAAILCKQYAFNELNLDEVFSIIRDTNSASQKVAKNNGMIIVDTIVKHYRGIDMPHYVFCAKNPYKMSKLQLFWGRTTVVMFFIWFYAISFGFNKADYELVGLYGIPTLVLVDFCRTSIPLYYLVFSIVMSRMNKNKCVNPIFVCILCAVIMVSTLIWLMPYDYADPFR
ncbi:MAG: hypothetical protein ATN35_11635 [Epulopiscium sp. Nele67-Bin004]|nr:MAG: hypothetical protein ATN35_11635 [Epulopiscium sp. Nele67-Bin004]